MLIFIWLIVTITIASSNLVNGRGATARIVGGVPGPISKFSYQISLQTIGGFHFCGGTIVTPRTIVTAAHCIEGKEPGFIRIRAGSNLSESGGQVVGVSEIIKHPKYNKKTEENDAALLILLNDLVFSSNVNKLPLCKTAPATGSTVTVSGWGLTQDGGSASEYLQTVDLKTVSLAECNKAYGDLTNEMMCAYSEGKDSCQFDSGGPLKYGDCLLGIVSFGEGCAKNGYPGVYASVPVLGPWIQPLIK